MSICTNRVCKFKGQPQPESEFKSLDNPNRTTSKCLTCRQYNIDARRKIDERRAALNAGDDALWSAHWAGMVIRRKAGDRPGVVGTTVLICPLRPFIAPWRHFTVENEEVDVHKFF